MQFTFHFLGICFFLDHFGRLHSWKAWLCILGILLLKIILDSFLEVLKTAAIKKKAKSLDEIKDQLDKYRT